MKENRVVDQPREVIETRDLLSNPVERELSRRVEQNWVLTIDGTAEKAVLKLGRSYTGIQRPKGYRKGKARRCFFNAGDLAAQELGIYVEGFAFPTLGSRPIHHAWITLDGVHAVDVTWDSAPDCAYFGIAFSGRVVRRWACREGYWEPLLGRDDAETFAMLEQARQHPPVFNSSEASCGRAPR